MSYKVEHISGKIKPKLKKRVVKKRVVKPKPKPNTKPEMDPIEKELREHFKKYHESEQTGEGWFSNALNGIKNIVSKTAGRVVGTFTGRNQLPPSARKVLENHGNEIISAITVYREPLQSLLNKAMSVITVGQIDKVKKDLNYDDLFHLFLVAFTQKGTKILIEKNHVINISLTQKAESEKREEIHIPINKPITINELLEKTKERMGSNFLIYSASTYNCQNFIMNILEANGLETPESRKFIMQDTEQVFKGLPTIFKKGSDFITNLASHGDVLLNGLGKRKRKRKT